MVVGRESCEVVAVKLFTLHFLLHSRHHLPTFYPLHSLHSRHHLPTLDHISGELDRWTVLEGTKPIVPSPDAINLLNVIVVREGADQVVHHVVQARAEPPAVDDRRPHLNGRGTFTGQISDFISTNDFFWTIE